MYNLDRAFSLLQEISFNRVAGTNEELKAAEILKSKIESLNLKATLENVEVDYSDVEIATLEVITPFKKVIKCEGVRMTGNTPKGGLEKKLLYIENAEDVNLQYAKDKIVLLNGRIVNKIYKKLIKAGVAGFISVAGSVYDDEEKTDLLVHQIRAKDYENGFIPGVSIRAKDAQDLILNGASTVKMILKQHHSKAVSHNVICEIEGSEFKDEIVAITAHYDSVLFSSGAYDNASGAVGIMEMLHYFVANPPKRTLKFIWCGAEEYGLLGSKAFVATHKEEIEKCVFNINIDMIGVILGKEIAVATAEKALVSYIDYVAKELGVACTSSQGVYSSDSTPFAYAGIPSVSFARIAPMSGAQIHSRLDVIDNMSKEAFASSLTLIIGFACRVINAKFFPIKREIPQNMKDELDYYYLNKERPSNN